MHKDVGSCTNFDRKHTINGKYVDKWASNKFIGIKFRLILIVMIREVAL